MFFKILFHFFKVCKALLTKLRIKKFLKIRNSFFSMSYFSIFPHEIPTFSRVLNWNCPRRPWRNCFLNFWLKNELLFCIITKLCFQMSLMLPFFVISRIWLISTQFWWFCCSFIIIYCSGYLFTSFYSIVRFFLIWWILHLYQVS